MQTTTRADEVDAETSFRVPSAYNQMMLRRGTGETPLVLTSSTAGSCFPTSALEALALRAFTETNGAGREAWVRELVGRSVLRLRIGDRVIEDRQEQIRSILAVIADVRAHRLKKLVEIGMLVPASRAV
jgi:hypothetical protein